MTAPAKPSPAASQAPEPRLGPAPEGAPLYVHLPFCAAKCHYCDFFSVPDEGEDVGGMVDALLAEARQRAPRRPRTVFLGGGTPSLLSERDLERLLDGLDAATDFRASAVEVTAECNPESLDRGKAERLLALGVTRLSIGLQSLRDEVLRSFGRVHDARDGLRAFEAAREAGARDVNVDMIYAVPGQTLAEWTEDLTRVLELCSEHLSAYNLTFEEGTRFHAELRAGRLHAAPEDLELALFARTRALAAEHGLEAYEISNFARSGRLCGHNVNYWRNGPYVGLGPSAVSRTGRARGGNCRSVRGYRQRIGARGNALSWVEEPPGAVRLAETWWLGLRLAEGVDPAAARGVAEVDEAHDTALWEARGLAAEGWLVERAGRFALSERGLPLADAIAARFLARAVSGDADRGAR